MYSSQRWTPFPMYLFPISFTAIPEKLYVGLGRVSVIMVGGCCLESGVEEMPLLPRGLEYMRVW